MVVVGETVIDAVFSPFGCHSISPPEMEGLAVNVMDDPSHMVPELTVKVGELVTVTFEVAVAFPHPVEV